MDRDHSPRTAHRMVEAPTGMLAAWRANAAIAPVSRPRPQRMAVDWFEFGVRLGIIPSHNGERVRRLLKRISRRHEQRGRFCQR
jgi:hypothetical protein